MAVHDFGGAAAWLSGLFQQTDDKDTRGRRVFLSCQEYFLFLDHVEAVRMCTASRHPRLVVRSFKDMMSFSGPC